MSTTKQLAPSEELKSLIEQLTDKALTLSSRVMTEAVIEQHVWDIWAYCREHQESLDSSQHCKMIRSLIEQAVGPSQLDREAKATALRELTREHAALKREHNKLLKQADKFEAERQTLLSQLDELRQTAEETVSQPAEVATDHPDIVSGPPINISKYRIASGAES